jgi:hypothetical protein
MSNQKYPVEEIKTQNVKSKNNYVRNRVIDNMDVSPIEENSSTDILIHSMDQDSL